jgi:hypothetical protein
VGEESEDKRSPADYEEDVPINSAVRLQFSERSGCEGKEDCMIYDRGRGFFRVPRPLRGIKGPHPEMAPLSSIGRRQRHTKVARELPELSLSSFEFITISQRFTVHRHSRLCW